MGFWIFMFCCNLLIPLVMIWFGRSFEQTAPKEINSICGYRTTRSMKNRDTWEFAHKYCGAVWKWIGTVMLPVSVLVSFLSLGRDADGVGTVGGLLCVVQLVFLVGSIIPTELALKKEFDEQGNRKRN